MGEDVENHTVRLLQEMRSDFDARFSAIDAKFDAFNERLTDLVQRIDGNTLTFNLVAGVAYNHEERITALEQPAE